MGTPLSCMFKLLSCKLCSLPRNKLEALEDFILYFRGFVNRVHDSLNFLIVSRLLCLTADSDGNLSWQRLMCKPDPDYMFLQNGQCKCTLSFYKTFQNCSFTDSFFITYCCLFYAADSQLDLSYCIQFEQCHWVLKQWSFSLWWIALFFVHFFSSCTNYLLNSNTICFLRAPYWQS